MVGFEEVTRCQDASRLLLAASARRPELTLPFWERWCRLHDEFVKTTANAEAEAFEATAAAFLRKRKAFLSSLFQAQDALPAKEREAELLAAVSQHDSAFRTAAARKLLELREEAIQARRVQRTVSAYASSSAF